MPKETIVLMDSDASKEINRIAGSKIKFKKLPIRITLQVDSAVVDALDKDIRFTANLYKATGDRYNTYCSNMGEFLKVYSAKQEKVYSDNRWAALKLDAEREGKALHRDIKKIGDQKFAKWVKTQKLVGKYKHDMKVDGALSSLAVVGGVVSVAMGVATGGLSLALSSVSLAKALARAARNFKRYTEDTAKSRQRLTKTLQGLNGSYHDSTRGQVLTRETAKNALDAFFAAETQTIKRAKLELKVYTGKISQSYEACAAVGILLHDYLDQSAKLQAKEKELTKVYDQTKTTESKAEIAKLKKVLESNQGKVAGTLREIDKLDKHLKKEDAFADWADKCLGDLDKRSGKWVARLNLAVMAADIATPTSINLLVNGTESLESGASSSVELLSIFAQ